MTRTEIIQAKTERAMNYHRSFRSRSNELELPHYAVVLNEDLILYCDYNPWKAINQARAASQWAPADDWYDVVYVTENGVKLFRTYNQGRRYE